MNNNVSFDAMLQMAARESLYRQLDSFPSKKELEKMFEPSKAHEDKIDKIIKKGNRSENLVKFNKHFTKAAVVLFIASTVTFTPLLTAKAVRESIVQTVIEWKDEFASIFFKSENEPAVINDVKIGYMVDGFEASGDIVKDEYSYAKTYFNDLQTININIISEATTTTTHTDNEYSNYYSININNNDGIWVYDKDYSILIMSDSKFIYNIYGNIDIGNLIEIYKNIEIF